MMMMMATSDEHSSPSSLRVPLRPIMSGGGLEPVRPHVLVDGSGSSSVAVYNTFEPTVTTHHLDQEEEEEEEVGEGVMMMEDEVSDEFHNSSNQHEHDGNITPEITSMTKDEVDVAMMMMLDSKL
jgi:hypothetical protein